MKISAEDFGEFYQGWGLKEEMKSDLSHPKPSLAFALQSIHDMPDGPWDSGRKVIKRKMITQFLSDVYYPASFPHHFICLNWRWKGNRKVIDPKENEIRCYPLKIFIQSIMSCQDISHWKFWKSWKDFFCFTTPAHFSNSLDFKLPTLQKLSQTKGRFIFQLKDQRALLSQG